MPDISSGIQCSKMNEMKTIFDKTEFFSSNILQSIKKLRILCIKEEIPFLICFAVKDDGDTTSYNSYINTSPVWIGLLSQDIIPDCVNVMFNGFKAVKYNVMEQDMENHDDLLEDGEQRAEKSSSNIKYDKTGIFSSEIKPVVESICSICNESGIPFLMVYAVSDNGVTTYYEKFKGEDDSIRGGLSKDILSDGIKVVYDNYKSAVYDIIEETEGGLSAEIESNEYIYCQNNQDTRKTERNKPENNTKKFPKSWEVRYH